MKTRTHNVTLIAPAIIAGIEFKAGDKPEVTDDQHAELVARGCLNDKPAKAEPKPATEDPK